ncbi:hypothetical protein Ahy_Scaffold6g108251 [Arachis hypogaea]|uniref:Uncharacterized protein n=1 Tax=Arachis hypogaea TaxID=3818 RepID=A0A444WQ07_ARAHY|nr:hypothetical protein Ahy_Scaffold6g108251 [Arachis hypogaea]
MLVDINRTFKEQYKRLYDYYHELLRTNPGSSMNLQAYNESFMRYRPMIGLDGCFFKMSYGGWLWLP